MEDNVHSSPMTIGFVGAGAMGSVMIERLLGADYSVLIFARRPDTINALVELGGMRAHSPAELGASSDIVIISLFTDQQVIDVCLGDDGLVGKLRPGGSLVIHTTGSPNTACRLAEAAAPYGVEVLDAPVSGGPDDIRSGRLSVLVGGDPATLERCRPVLSTYADPIMHIGSVGSGQRVKLINNALFAAHLAMASEAVRLGQDLGIDDRVLTQAISRCSGDSRAVSMAAMAPSISVLLNSVRPFLTKDLAVVDQVADEVGVDLGILGELGRTAIA